jgi:hypothetical protein
LIFHFLNHHLCFPQIKAEGHNFFTISLLFSHIENYSRRFRLSSCEKISSKWGQFKRFREKNFARRFYYVDSWATTCGSKFFTLNLFICESEIFGYSFWCEKIKRQGKKKLWVITCDLRLCPPRTSRREVKKDYLKRKFQKSLLSVPINIGTPFSDCWACDTRKHLITQRRRLFFEIAQDPPKLHLYYGTHNLVVLKTKMQFWRSSAIAEKNGFGWGCQMRLNVDFLQNHHFH